MKYYLLLLSMPVRSNIALPECPALIPLAGGSCTPGADNWNKLVSSQKFIQQAGIVIFEASSQRNNGSIRPVMGDFGDNFTEVYSPTFYTLDTPIELFPGLNDVMLIVSMKLARLQQILPAYMNQAIEISIIKGAAVQPLATFIATGGTGYVTGNIVTGANAPYFNALRFTLNQAIIPQAGQTEWATIRIRQIKYNARVIVTGSGATYYDGLTHITIKQFKDCP